MFGRVVAAVLGAATTACGGGGGGESSPSAVPAGGSIVTTPTGASAPEPVVQRAPVIGTAIDVITTRSGHWRLFALPAQGSAAVYRMTLDEKPAFAREFACRPIATKERGDGIALDVVAVKLLDTDAKVAQGACRVVQNMDPVAPNLGWLREAVSGGILPSYKRERAWISGLKPLASDPDRSAYDPTSLGPRTDGAATPPTASHNFVGTTSSQGGEYEASRGFLHNADARVVDAALHDESAAVAAYWPEFIQYSFYSLAQPQGAAWSVKSHVTVDPQFPQDGERGWELPFHNNPNPAVDSLTEVDDWGRNLPHLENTGFVHWLATEDPIAGLVVQRQAAYALAGRYEYLRGGYSGTAQLADTAYEGSTDEERGLFNTLSALWKSRDVSRRISSAEGRMFWSQARTERQADDVIAFYDAIASRIAAAGPASPADYLAALSGTTFASTGVGSFILSDGSTLKLRQTSAFETVQYGKEPLWLWAKAGKASVRNWFTAYATGLTMRMSVIGGAMGVDGRTSTGGSGYPVGPTTVSGGVAVAAAPPFSTPAGWAEWVARLPLKQVDARDSFDGASVHTAMQMEGALLMARDLGLQIPELDSALSRIKQARAATTTFRYSGLQMHKHLGAPAQ
ncbi:MAG: hypothetical protein Q7J32_00150 [Sphingomonadaceae bacterium]|nr:hypothetical protein [Sphingomonadaceae bacterium]